MATSKEKTHSLASILLISIIFGSIAVLVFIPVDVVERVRAVEQASIVRWLGMDADQWIMLKIFDFLQGINNQAHELIDSTDLTGNAKIDSWGMQRMYAALVWLHIVVYRVGVLLMWLAFGIPVIMVTLADGYLKREISKTNFSSQSPVLHKSGMDAFKGVTVLLLGWVLIPWYLSMLSAPLGIFVISAAGWIWISNAPKRI